MIIRALRGRDLAIDSTERVLIRAQGKQWRIDAPTDGTAVWAAEHTRSLSYYGGRAVTGSVWIGKTKHDLIIEAGG